MPLFIPSVGLHRNDLYTGIPNRWTLVSNINSTLVAAGWSSTFVPAWQIALFSSQPTAAQTIIIAGRTYTFRASVSSPDDVAIGLTTTDTCNNLITAINSGSGGGLPNANVTAELTTTSALIPFSGIGVRINAISSDFTTSTAFTCDDTSTSITWYNSNAFGQHYLTNWGYILTCPATPQGLRYKIFAYTTQGETGDCRTIIFNVPNTKSSGIATVDTVSPGVSAYGAVLRYSSSTDWRVIANAHQCFILSNGVAGNACQYLTSFSGTPYVPSFQKAITITMATNATPIVITTATPHGLTTGDAVCVREVGGNTGANINTTVTVSSPTTLSLDGSVGNGAYTSGGIIGKISSATGGQLAECIWHAHSTSNSSVFLRTRLSSEGLQYWTLLNNADTTNTNSNGQGSLKLLCPVPATTSYAGNDVKCYNGQELGSTPFLLMGSSISGTDFVVGSLWSAAIVLQSQSVDDPGSMLGYNFWNLTDANIGSSTNVRGSLYVVVP